MTDRIGAHEYQPGGKWANSCTTCDNHMYDPIHKGVAPRSGATGSTLGGEPTREQLDNLVDRAGTHVLTPAEADRLRDGLTALRQQLALSQAGASQRETLLTEARDALEEHGGHGDAWPDIVAPILELIGERDRLAGAVQRVRDLLDDRDKVQVVPFGNAVRIGELRAALDAQPEPAADTETTTPLTDHRPTGEQA